ncbi:hypothetical protein HBI09_087980 [Parastagonospora nodorum]|nr:hypothetical protein HBI09_087980 [Parastagonospora nodorum]KAH5018729.1 hypothetical protein HBI77_047030 [Parastagonospora nodorum]
MSPAENYPLWSFKTFTAIVNGLQSLGRKVDDQTANMEKFEGRLLAIETALGELTHSTSPPGGEPNNATVPKAGHQYTEFRCPHCPPGATKMIKYGKPWEDHFIKDHLEFYTPVEGSGYNCWDCGAHFRTSKKLAEHMWKFHVKTAQK